MLFETNGHCFAKKKKKRKKKERKKIENICFLLKISDKGTVKKQRRYCRNFLTIGKGFIIEEYYYLIIFLLRLKY